MKPWRERFPLRDEALAKAQTQEQKAAVAAADCSDLEDGEYCLHCGAVHERGDDGRCNRCGESHDVRNPLAKSSWSRRKRILDKRKAEGMDPREYCQSCGAVFERGEDGICNSCNRPYDVLTKSDWSTSCSHCGYPEPMLASGKCGDCGKPYHGADTDDGSESCPHCGSEAGADADDRCPKCHNHFHSLAKDEDGGGDMDEGAESPMAKSWRAWTERYPPPED